MLPPDLNLRRAHRIESDCFDLSTLCPCWGYRTQSAEILRAGWGLIPCPSCGKGFGSSRGKNASARGLPGVAQAGARTDAPRCSGIAVNP